MRKLAPLRALHAFEAAARHHSFAATAKELGVTPTAISHQIRQLEEACGIKLFQRRPRPLLLSSAGARLYPALCNGFDALASAVALLAEEDVQAPLRVTSPSAFASKWLVPQLPKWREENPTAPLEIIGTDAGARCESGRGRRSDSLCKKAAARLCGARGVSGRVCSRLQPASVGAPWPDRAGCRSAASSFDPL
jgi:biotin operon repressor